jgi:hypothetical protein
MEETILINGVPYSPHFILDVTPEDSEEKVNKSFRKKAKMWHPDKLSPEDRNDPIKVESRKQRFKILVDCYDYILSKKSSFSNSRSNARQEINIPRNNNIPTKNLDNSSELDNFNKEFENSRVQTPNDFGYSNERLKDLKDYDNFEYKPAQLFDAKQFNPTDFNKAFEYNQETQGLSASRDVGVYFKTTDGFNAYNAGDSGGFANVSSFNGVMIVGDSFGQNGSGYFDTNYSDYKQVFSAPKNPNEQISVPQDFQGRNTKVVPLSDKEAQEQMNLQIQMRQMNLNSGGGSSKQNFQMQEQMFLEKQQDDIKQKIDQDKNFVLQYRHMYKDQNTIDQALNGNLIRSSDYVSEDNIDKRFLRTKFN